MSQNQPNDSERAFSFLPLNDHPAKPRTRGITEIRGPYYTPMGKRYLQDILETMGEYVDSLKFAGGSFSLMPRRAVRELLDLCHQNNVVVSTGGFMEHVLTVGRKRSMRISMNAVSLALISSKFPPALSPSPLTTGCAWSKRYRRQD